SERQTTPTATWLAPAKQGGDDSSRTDPWSNAAEDDPEFVDEDVTFAPSPPPQGPRREPPRESTPQGARGGDGQGERGERRRRGRRRRGRDRDRERTPPPALDAPPARERLEDA